MQKLLKNDNQIIRVLQTKNDKVLVINCVKRTMPMWITLSDIEDQNTYIYYHGSKTKEI